MQVQGEWCAPFRVHNSTYIFYKTAHIGIGQGLRRSVFSVAAILGPLWAGGAVAFSTYYVLLAVPLALIIFITVGPKLLLFLAIYSCLSLLQVLVSLSFVRLKEPRGRHILLP